MGEGKEDPRNLMFRAGLSGEKGGMGEADGGGWSTGGADKRGGDCGALTNTGQKVQKTYSGKSRPTL